MSSRRNFAFVVEQPDERPPILAPVDHEALLRHLRALAEVRKRQAAEQGHPVEVFQETPAFLRKSADCLERIRNSELGRLDPEP